MIAKNAIQSAFICDPHMFKNPSAQTCHCLACTYMDIEVIDMAVNPDHVHLFIKYPPKHSLSYIAKIIKGRSSRILRKEFPHLKEWCGSHLWAPSCYHGSVGNGWDVVEKYISAHNTYEYNEK